MARTVAALAPSGGLLLLVSGALVSAGAAPTFTRDVAPILYAKCVSCHRAGEVAPMALLTYEDARPWARAIKARVASRQMPPWFADPKFGRELANNPGLTDREIATIVAWADSGAPRGTGDPPSPPLFPQGWHTFKNRAPDAVIEMPMEFDVPADGTVPVFTLWAPNPFKEDKFIEAVELRPGATGAVHHSDVTARALPPGTTLGRGRAWKGGPLVDFVPVYSDGRSYNELSTEPDGHEAAAPAGPVQRAALQREAFRTTDDYRLLFYVPGGGFQEFPAGAVKRISAGNVLAWNLHYTPTGRPQRDRHRLALWFARSDPVHEVITKRIGEAHIVEGREFVAEPDRPDFPTIPPFANDWRITAITPLQDDVTLYSLWPHMHLRGKDMTFIVTYPDGREEVLLHVPNYEFRWQLQYQLAKPLHLPAGSTIKAIGHYDNSAGNKYNPRPDAAVGWSEQSRDEMFNGWMEISIDKDRIAPRAVYTLATPRNSRVSLGIGSGPSGTVYVRNADGSVLTSATIGPVPSFIEPWTFAPGQTIETERSGAGAGSVTVTMFDVPPDVTASTAIDGPDVALRIEQPGQNGIVRFAAAGFQEVEVHVAGNTIGTIAVKLVRADATTLASTTSSAAGFGLPSVPIAAGAYSVIVDPAGAGVGAVTLSLTTPRR